MPQWLQRVRTHGDSLLAMGVFGLLGIMVVPLPPVLLDMLLAGSICLALLLFLGALYARKAVEFSVFPTLLLVATVYRLALNVASTRLILLHGSNGSAAAGRIIETFGQFVVGGNFVVGAVVFTILVLINFVVITKGSGAHRRGRSEVHPRRDARQADGGGRRAQRGAHRRAHREEPAIRDRDGGGLLRRDGRRVEVHPRRRHRRHRDHGDQRGRGRVHRHVPAGHGPVGRRDDLHPADHRGWPGGAGPPP